MENRVTGAQGKVGILKFKEKKKKGRRRTHRQKKF